MLNQETIQTILGIKEKVYVTPLEMADKMNITFFPYVSKGTSDNVVNFSNKLKETFRELNVNIVPYNESLVKIPISKSVKSVLKILFNNLVYIFRRFLKLPENGHYFNLDSIKYLFKRTKIKKGISVIVLGEQDSKNLPMQYIYSFKDNSVITILDFPKNISDKSTFHEHFDEALKLFAHNMTNIVIGVDSEKWLLYNFNASHPVFSINENFKENVLHALIPKIVAPIRPYTLSEFVVSNNHFSIIDDMYKSQVEDLVKGALIFSKTNLYPAGKKIDDLPFRNNFYRWIGKLHLDNRNGMSYGFLAVQLPGEIYPLVKEQEFQKKHGNEFDHNFTFIDENLYIKINLENDNFWLRVPDVWVLSQKSGSDKTHVNPKRDLIKLGLSNGKMYLESQYDSVIDNDYKTSFDTQVILAHSVGNAIIASVLNHINPESEFVKRYKNFGISISHWHGYIHPEHVQPGWFVHGIANPHVACSSPQSAIYALDGKLKSFSESLKNSMEFKGDIHIEPHHGTNICYTSISDLANYLVNNPQASVLGNSYYYLYNK
ncbi:MAG TPA: hypothetical protein PLZ99_01500 [Parcubacteria group bacterium]|jgi:hypothetical protein|nr:hypothetical protein [Parcubacteria group bacterium]